MLARNIEHQFVDAWNGRNVFCVGPNNKEYNRCGTQIVRSQPICLTKALSHLPNTRSFAHKHELISSTREFLFCFSCWLFVGFSSRIRVTYAYNTLSHDALKLVSFERLTVAEQRPKDFLFFILLSEFLDKFIHRIYGESDR